MDPAVSDGGAERGWCLAGAGCYACIVCIAQCAERLPLLACNSSHNPQPKIGQYLEITRLCILAPSNYVVTLQTCNYRKRWLLKLFITLQHPQDYRAQGTATPR